MSEAAAKPKLVVIGNGMAGMHTVEHLLNAAPDLYDITVFGSEPLGNYNRMLLSPVLAGETRLADIMINNREWYGERNITLHSGKAVTMIDRVNRRVLASDGTSEAYDRLLVATGSSPILLPLPGKNLAGVITFRDMSDVDAMLEASAKYRNAVVIGGGLLGLEAANGLIKRGMRVTVVHLMDSLMERQLDPRAALLLKGTLEARGMAFKMPAQTAALLGGDRVTAVRFADGEEIAADLVVIAVGIRPNIELAKKAGLHCQRGIVVSDTMQSYDGRIYAVGECAEHRRQTYGLVAPLYDQARVCANHLAGLGRWRYQGSALSTKLKVSGIDVFSAGTFGHEAEHDEIVMEDTGRGIYKRIVLRGDKIVGAVLYGDTRDGAWYFDALRDGADVSAYRDNLAFGKASLASAMAQ